MFFSQKNARAGFEMGRPRAGALIYSSYSIGSPFYGSGKSHSIKAYFSFFLKVFVWFWSYTTSLLRAQKLSRRFAFFGAVDLMASNQITFATIEMSNSTDWAGKTSIALDARAVHARPTVERFAQGVAGLLEVPA
jgi:hypothetical protein